ncbi:hypothetical protein NM208_g5322 [Fusarium decemcellulare]|uniref:Uncharacterized protein n=1 Tax=Fusarium decemcellulare TaxID=57161 RepID=A0ACC1SHE9_9HYPO|nr:hypothetical protein NM208_g5322 [Fusarium decemcellulare]
MAFRDDNIAMMKLLLEHGSDAYSPYMGKDGPLGRSAVNGEEEMVAFLLEQESEDKKSKADHMWSALVNAAWEGHREIVKMLLEKGDFRENGGYRTAWHAARDCDYDDIVEMLEPYLSDDEDENED